MSNVSKVRPGIAFALILIMSCALLRSANAATVTYTTLASFNNALKSNPYLNPKTVTFDDQANGYTIPNGSVYDGLTWSTSAPSLVITNAYGYVSSPNTLGANYPTQTFFNDGDSLDIMFPKPVYAFGVWFDTYYSYAGAYSLTTDTNQTAQSGYNPVNGPYGEFAGLITSQPFTSIHISSQPTPVGVPVADEGFVIDNATYAVPEPGALAMLAGSGLSMLGFVLRRRKA